MNNSSPLATGVGDIVLLIVLVIWLIASRYRVACPNEVYIITGQKGKAVTNPGTGLVSTNLSGQKIIMSGGVFVISLIQRLHALGLPSRRIMVQIHNAVSGQDIRLNLDGAATVKVGGNKDSIRAAAQRFLMQQGEIETFTQETLVDALRPIVGGPSIGQIIHNRATFAQRVANESEVSLTGQGLVLGTFQTQDITDDGTCLSDLGRPESAKVGQIAAIAEANARRKVEQTRLAAEQEIAISEREPAFKEAEVKAEMDTARAQAAVAGPLAQAGRDQTIPTGQEKVAVRQAAPEGHQLDTEVRKPVDARRYETETAAQGRYDSEIFGVEARGAVAIANVEAQAEIARLIGEGEKQHHAALAEAEAIEGARRDEAEKAYHIAEAGVVRAEGEAKIVAALAVSTAEAETMNKQAAAFTNYSEAVVLQMLIEVLSQVVEKVAAPIGSIDKLTVVSTEKAATLLRQVNGNVPQAVETIKNTTDTDLLDILKGHTDGKVLRGETTE